MSLPVPDGGEFGSTAGSDAASASAFPRLRSWWQGITFGTEKPARRVTALGLLGAVTGLAETALVLLLVTMVSGSGAARLPIVGDLDAETAVLAAVALLVLAALALTHLGSALITARAASDAQRRIQAELIDAYLGAPWVRQADVRSGELQDVVMDKAVMLAHGTQEAATALAVLLSVVVLIAGAVAISPWAALVLLATIGVAILAGLPFRAHRGRISEGIVRSSTDLAVEVGETGDGVRDLRVFGVLEAARGRLVDAVTTYARDLRALQFTGAAVPALIRDTTLALLVVALALVVGTADVSLPVLGTVVLLMLRALSHAQSLSNLGYFLQEREANLNLIRRRMDQWSRSQPLGSQPCSPIRHIALDDVTYTYPGAERPALERVEFELARGERLGIVGRTGAGKSTLAAILLGLIVPDAGRVSINGVGQQKLTPAEWNRRTAWIGQEPHLLTATVQENIRFLRRELDDDAVERAALAAGLGPELEQWPEGLNHFVGPSGIGISGGQRQRVALARALAAGPDLLVLDEPTSALDVHAEAAFRNTLLRLDDAIVVVIAHRLSTIEACDRVAIIEGGRTIAIAPPADLSIEQPYFREALELSTPRS